MSSNNSSSSKSQELKDSELESAAGGAGKQHPKETQPWEPDMGENQEIVPEGPHNQDVIQDPTPDDGSIK